MKVKFGLCNVHIAPLTFDGTVYSYETPIKIPGAVSLSLEPSGESNDFYADNIKYFTSTDNQGYEGDLELALLPDAIRTVILGESQDANGALVEAANDTNRPFAFGFQIEGDEKARRFWYYNCTMARPTNSASTKESTKEPATETLNIKSLPRETDKKVRVLLTETETNKATYDDFFESVYESASSV